MELDFTKGVDETRDKCDMSGIRTDRPWFGVVIESGIDEMKPVFRYCYDLSRSALLKIPATSVLDIGCGSVGKYLGAVCDKALFGLTSYVGVDIDSAKLEQGFEKVLELSISRNRRLSDSATTTAVSDSFVPDSVPVAVASGFQCSIPKFHFFSVDCNQPWSPQMSITSESSDHARRLANNCQCTDGPFDLLLAVFTFQYANVTSSSFIRFVSEVNSRSKGGSRLFIEWIDADRLSTDESITTTCDHYVTVLPSQPSATLVPDPEQSPGSSECSGGTGTAGRGLLQVSLPHRPTHVEPILRLSHIMEAFVMSGLWSVDVEMTDAIEWPTFDQQLPLWRYVRLVNRIVLVKR